MEKIILSICIPTYNGGERLERLIRHILKSDRTDFEIAISDNQSTDDTADRINRIHDNRVHFYENEENLGSLENGIRALQIGQGEYLMLLIDRDIVQIEYMAAYIDFLIQNQYDVIINQAHFFNQNFGCELLRDRKYYYLCKSPHPSYYVFKKTAFDKVDIVDRITKNGYYPALIGLNIAQQEGVVYLNAEVPVLLECELSYTSMHSSKSWTVLGKQKKSDMKHGTFVPNSQMGLLDDYLCYLKDISMDNHVLDDALAGIYHSLLENAMDYIHVMESTRTKYRYSVPDYHYEMKDYIGIADDFFNRFTDCVQRLDFKYDKDLIELITELVRLEFMNNTISQTYSDFNNNEKQIARIRQCLTSKGFCEDAAEMKRDINLKAGIENTKG